MKRHVVLVVEDNDITRKVVRLALGNEGFLVAEASRADEALAAVATTTPDLILQDLLLADIDGIDLVRRFRALPDMRAVPIIAFSGFLSRLEGRVAACGFTDVLAKPIEPSKLVQVVRKHLPGAAKRDQEAERGCRILVVDDDPLQLKAATYRLKLLGFDVTTAIDGLSALEIVRNGAIDAVLSDVLMPRIDGFQLCAEIRRDPALARIPVVLASSSYVEDADRALAERMGASAFVVREPDLEKAVAELTSLISRPRKPIIAAAPDPAAYHMRVLRQLERQTALNTKSVQQSSMHASILSVVAGMSEVLSRQRTIDGSLPDVLASLLDASGVSRGALFLSTAPPGGLRLATTLGFDQPSVDELHDFCHHRAFFDRVIGSRQPSALRKTGDDQDASDLLARIGVDAAIVIPLVSGDEDLGVVLLASQTLDLSDHEWIAFGRMIAVQVGQALALARAFNLLSASERRCRTLIDRASDCIVILDLDGRIDDVNPEGRRFLGATLEHLIGRSVFDLIEPHERERAREDFLVLVENGRIAHSTSFMRPDGAIVIADISATVVEIEGSRVVMSIWRDVTEKHRVEADRRLMHSIVLAASEAPDLAALFDGVLHTLGDAGSWRFGASWRPHADTGTLQCEHVWAKSREQRAELALITASTIARGKGVLGRAWASKTASWTRDLAAQPDCPRSPTAAMLGLHACIVIPVVADEEVIAVIELFKDVAGDADGFMTFASTLMSQLGSIIERKRAHEALRASEARFSRLWESAVVGIVIAETTTGKLLDANDAYLMMVGHTRADLAAGHVGWLGESLLDGWSSPEQQTAPREMACVHNDGHQVPVMIRVAMLDAERSIAIVADLSEQRRVEESLFRSDEQLRQSQKMEAVGALAGGIAHDFNNALVVVLSYGDLILSALPPNDPMRDDVEEICKAGRSAAGLTRQLLMFSRQQIVEPKITDLDDVLLGVDRMLRRILGADIELVSRPTDGLGTAWIDPGSLEQVIMNLAVNARDAMPTGGKLTMETANVDLNDKHVTTQFGASAGPHVMLAVTDTGIGMDATTRSRIFEPFFTTKATGKGTGLGLSTVFGIVQQNGGAVSVFSEPGHGTRFEIYLPRIDGIAEPRAKTRPMLTTTRGTETIMVVDDEDQVRAVAGTILRRSGYTIIEARDPIEAMRLLERSAKVDLLLSDVVMPVMSGPALARRVASSRPAIKILCMSGHSDDKILVDSRFAYLQKPFTPETLTRKVREVLDARGE